TEAQNEQILLLASGLRQLVADLRRGERMSSNKVVVASQHSTTTALIPSVIKRVRQHSEHIHIRLLSANLDECTGLLLSRQADVAIVFQLADDTNEFRADYLEAILIGNDRLIPVFSEALEIPPTGVKDLVDLPLITYPADVFFGKVMERKIMPFLPPAAYHTPKVETALTLAALEMAASGIGIAWVPESLAASQLQSGRLVDLSAILPACDLQIRAMRLEGWPSPAQELFWSQLISQEAASS
ncbi:MAG: substrate-binding domain-containing protein, partial [Paracoccaceae bacterium]